MEDIEKGGRLLEHKTVGERKAVGDKTVFAKGDILYSKLRPYLLKILVAPDGGICTPEIVPFRVYGGINPNYIVNYLKSPYVDNLINSITYGVKMPRVGTETMTTLLVPIPTLDEQRRIVEKIDEVAAAVSAYDVAYQKTETLNSPKPSRSRYCKRQSRASWYRKTHPTSLQRLCWSVSGRRSSGSSRKAKSKRTSTNPSFSDGIILIMRSWTVWSTVFTMNCPLRYRKIGVGHGSEASLLIQKPSKK